MATAPFIGVSTSVTVAGSTVPERAHLNSTYLAAVQQAGGVPVLLPPQLVDRGLAALLTHLDGVLLTGGGDVDPARFAEPPHPATTEVSKARDGLEIAVVEYALDQGLPLLAICRGIQVLNVALGGSLYQDVKSDPGTPIAHSQTAPRHEVSHAVKVETDSAVAEISGSHALDVNSLHHQAIKRLGRGLRAVAFAPDGLVEGVEQADRSRFLIGVQWHPEELAPHHESARRLFAALIEAATVRSR